MFVIDTVSMHEKTAPKKRKKINIETERRRGGEEKREDCKVMSNTINKNSGTKSRAKSTTKSSTEVNNNIKNF